MSEVSQLPELTDENDPLTIVDTPTHRLVFTELWVETKERLLEQIRERRLAPLRVYEELQSKKERITAGKARQKSEKLVLKAGKIEAKLVGAIEEYEALIRDMKAMLIEAGE